MTLVPLGGCGTLYYYTLAIIICLTRLYRWLRRLKEK